jgi:hypothetical protein
MAAVAGPFKVGAEANLGLAQPLVGSDLGSEDGISSNPTGSSGLGFSIGPVAEYAITPMFGLKGGIAYAWSDLTVKESASETTEMGSYSATENAELKMSSLEFSIGPTIRINDKFSAGIGYRWSMPIGGTGTTSESFNDNGYVTNMSQTQDVDWAGSTPDTSKADILSTHSIYIQAGYEVIPHLTVGLDVTIGLTGLEPKTNAAGTSYDGAYPRSSNIVQNRYALNVRYDFL